jgi:hypothetical protein
VFADKLSGSSKTARPEFRDDARLVGVTPGSNQQGKEVTTRTFGHLPSGIVRSIRLPE